MKLLELKILWDYYCEEYPDLKPFLKTVLILVIGLVFVAAIIALPYLWAFVLLIVSLIVVLAKIEMFRSYEKEEL